MALAKGLVPSLLSQAAARAAEPLAHITRTLVQLEVIDHDVGQTALSNYLKNCLAKSKGISGPSYNPANGSHTLHRHIAAAVPVASLLKVRGKELLSALHRTREEPEAAPSYTELQASADASAAAARRHRVMRHGGRWPRMQTDRGMCVVYMLISALPQNGGDI